LIEQRILFLGAGSAAIGIANLIVAAMQKKGLSQDAARSRVSMFDIGPPTPPHPVLDRQSAIGGGFAIAATL